MGFARGGSRGQGKGHRQAPQELTQEVHGRAATMQDPNFLAEQSACASLQNP